MEYKGTKGEFRYSKEDLMVVDEKGFSIAEPDDHIRIDVAWGEKGAKHWNQEGFHILIAEQEATANGEMIADAFNTSSKTGLLPSTILKQRDDAFEFIQEFLESVISEEIIIHENLDNDGYENCAGRLISSAEKLIKSITESK